jgi:D-xylose transport system permease protein
MSDPSTAAAIEDVPSPRRTIGDLIRQTEIDLRLLGMVVALAAILLGFGAWTDGQFLKPENLVTLSVQAASIAIIATGMVLVIVIRQIDLSVGSIVGVVAMTDAVLMAEVFPHTIGSGTAYGWLIALLAGIGVGGLIGAFQGFIIAYIGVPSFVVTLGGLLAWRGLVWVIAGGATITYSDQTFILLGGSPEGSIGGTLSWIVGLVICGGLILILVNSRRQRRRFGFPVRPMWAEALLGIAGSALTLGAVWVANAYHWPPGLAQKYVADHPGASPPVEAGIPIPILIVIVVTLIVSFAATRLRFGRSIFAIGGNPEAAELAGINTRWTVMKTFILLGLLCGIAGAISAARLASATIDIGQFSELLVIAAAVIGGTSFAGGIGSVPGAVLGALVMQSLAYGLSFKGLASPIQNIVEGIVLVIAVGFDTWNRGRTR